MSVMLNDGKLLETLLERPEPAVNSRRYGRGEALSPWVYER